MNTWQSLEKPHVNPYFQLKLPAIDDRRAMRFWLSHTGMQLPYLLLYSSRYDGDTV